ncbi:MAG: tetratricopeptide repeat protein [Acidobacteria bacterium]|nr:tetratricopeptide repeat protein [Acidobacteriota bacterium]
MTRSVRKAAARARFRGFVLLALSTGAAAAAGEVPAPPSQAGSPSAQPTVADLVARADREIKAGRIFDAIGTLESAVKLAPERTDVRLHLAALEKQRGMWLRSAEQYRAVLAANPSNAEGKIAYAELLLAEYQFRAAADEFRGALELRLEAIPRDRALVGLGNAQFGMGRYDEASDTYRLLLSRKPDEPTALAFLNIARRKIGDLDGAIEGWRRFLVKQPDIVRAQVLLAEAETLRASIVRQKDLVAAHPQDVAFQLQLASLLQQQPDLAGAASAYRAALALRPNDPAGRMKLAAVLRDAGDYPAAAKEFQALLADDSLGDLACANLAYCARRAGDAALEVSAWRRALELNPRDAYAYRLYLIALGRAGRVAEEAALVTKAIKERPADPLPRIEYALLARAGGAEEESLRALLDALVIEPNDAYARSELRSALALQPARARKLLDEVSAASGKEPDPTIGALRRAAVLRAVGRDTEAEGVLAAAAAGGPGDARLLVALAVSHRDVGAPPADVAAELGRARDIAPDYFQARFYLASTLLAMSRFDETAAEAQAAVRLVPNSAEALAILGAAWRGAGGEENLSRARGALRRALELDPMDTGGATRFLLAKVAWQLGYADEANAALKGDLPVEPDEMYRLAWESVRDNYFDRTFNGQEWARWRDRFAGKLETESDALGAIALMLASLDNRDTRLRSADQTANLFFTPRATTIQRDPLGKNTVTSKTVATSTVEGNVGYVAISNMADPKLVGEVSKAMGEMKEKDAVILDLRGNPGGGERDVEDVTAMLVKPGTPTGKVITADGSTTSESHGQKAPIIPDKPVVVLIDRNTGSSAEALAGALKESHRAVIVGEPTYGKAGIQFPRLLPDGTTLLVAVAENANLAGVPYTGVGIQPDVPVDSAMPSQDPSGDAAMNKAKEILGKERSRRRPAPQPAPAP